MSRPITIRTLIQRLRDDFKSGSNDFVLLYAYNGTGKTRLSMEFKEAGKRRRDLPADKKRDTLYFNAFTEDLFHWDNDLDGDSERVLILNKYSKFFPDIKSLGIEDKIRVFLHRYSDFNFSIDINKKTDRETNIETEYWAVNFTRESVTNGTTASVGNIKVSRGEENIFIWCFFLAIVQLAIDNHEDYTWVKHFYIDDPISSLDDNNAIAVASDLAHLLKSIPTDENGKRVINSIISSHHGLFFNVMCNELKKLPHKKYFLHRAKEVEGYILRSTDDTPFFHHVAMLDELRKTIESGKLYAYHFNMLRNVLEKTATFFGFKDFSECLHGIDDENLYARALNLLSHGKYSVYEPKEMVEDNKKLFKDILEAFLERYRFDLPELH